MKRVAFLLLMLCGLSPTASSSESKSPATGFGIADIQAKLFYSNSGRLSANVFGNSKVVLHNVVIGEGVGIEGPSDNTLLIVRLQGPPKASVDGLKLRVIARAEKDTLLDREIGVGRMNTTGNEYSAYWLYGTGCAPITVEAVLTLGNESERVVATIPFECSD
jgi:hypothetical protein